MPTVNANNIDLYYEDVGDANAPVILLIMGLGTQMIAWPEVFVNGLAAAGFRVISFDNRDIGLSTHLNGAPAPNLIWTLTASRFGLPVRVAYSLKDMAADAVALMDKLNIPAAHIVGASMGGMIAQIIAATSPDRVLSLTSVMSSSGAPGLPGPSAALRKKMIAKRPAKPTREDAITATVQMLELMSYPDPARVPDAFETMAARSYDRGFNALGTKRQLLAIISDGSRAGRLAQVRTPTLVIHGAADPLVPLACSEDIARRVTGARLEIVQEMGHDLPPSQMPHVMKLIVDHASAA